MMFINPIPFIPFPLIRGRRRVISREASLARGDSVDLSLTLSQRRGKIIFEEDFHPTKTFTIWVKSTYNIIIGA